MHVIRRLTVSILCCLALGVGMLAVAPTSPARAADTAACTDAKAAVTRAVKHEHTTKHRLVLAKRALAKAKRTHRKAKIAKARKVVRTRTRTHRRAAVALRNARSHRSSACATTGGNGGGGTTPAAGLGSLLALLTASLNGGSVPALDASQLTSLLDSLYPGASSALSPSDLTAILAAFDSAGSLDPTQLTGLLAGLPGADQLDPTQLVGLLSGGSLDPTALTGLLTTVTGALGDLGPTGLGNPADAVTAITGLLGTLLGGQTDPTQALGTLLGLLAAAGGGGTIPGLDASQFTSLLNGLYPGASTALDPAALTALYSAFPDAGSMNLTQLTDLLSGIGASGVDPTQLLAVLNGSPLSAGQATALTSSITALLSGVSGTSFTSPANPLAAVGSLLQSLLGGVLCGVLNLLC